MHDYGRLFEEKDFQVAITKMNWHATAPDQCTGARGAGEGVSIPWAIRSNLTLFPFYTDKRTRPTQMRTSFRMDLYYEDLV
jgi:hypothetical protein